MKAMHSVALVASVAITTACALPAAAAQAQEAPKRKSGQWEIASAVSGQPPFVAQVCIDEKTDDIAKSAGSSVQQSECESAAIKKEGDSFVTESVCKQRNSTVTTRAVLTGDFAAAYKGEVETNYNPPLYGRTQVKATLEAKFVGPCTQ